MELSNEEKQELLERLMGKGAMPANINLGNMVTNNYEQGSNPVVNNNPVFNAPVTFYAGKKNSLSPSQQKVKSAIEQLLHEGVLKDGIQWWAIYRVLSDKCNYTTNKKDFAALMNNMEIDQGTAPCEYNNWRNFTPSHLQASVDTWADMPKESLGEAEKRQVAVGIRLMELLEQQ